MGTRFSVVLFGIVCGVASLVSTGIRASDGHLEHALSGSIPSYGGFAAAQPFLLPTPMQPPELALTPLPPGTIGQTYTRPSHPVPVDEHPRTGMLAVRDHGRVPYLSVQNMGGIKMKSGIWLFESARPLDPGACQIVRVEARETAQDIEPYSTKFVRLIPGRIVYLDF